MPLFDSAVAAVMGAGHAPSDARNELLACINDATRSEFSINDLGAWEAGTHPVPATVHRALLELALESALYRCGGIPPDEDRAYQALVDMLACANVEPS